MPLSSPVVFVFGLLLFFSNHFSSLSFVDAYPQPRKGNASTWMITGTNNPTDVEYYPIQGWMIYVETATCRVISVKWYRGTITTLIGDDTSVTCSDVDHANPNTARLNSPYGAVVSGSSLYVTTLNKVKLMNMVSMDVSTYAGQTTSGNTVNVDKLSALFSNPRNIREYKSVIYIVDYQNNAFQRISKVSSAVSTLASSFNVPLSLTIYKDYAYSSKNNEFCIYKIHLRTGVVTGGGNWLGSCAISGTTIAPVRYQSITALYYDCYRRAMFIGDQKYVKRYNFRSKNVEIIAGDGTTTYNGPNRRTALTYRISTPTCLDVARENYLFGCSNTHTSIFVVGIESAYKQKSCNITTSRSTFTHSITSEQTMEYSRSRSRRTETQSFTDTLTDERSLSRSKRSHTDTHSYTEDDTISYTESRTEDYHSRTSSITRERMSFSKTRLTHSITDSATDEETQTLKYTKTKSTTDEESASMTFTFSTTKEHTDTRPTRSRERSYTLTHSHSHSVTLEMKTKMTVSISQDHTFTVTHTATETITREKPTTTRTHTESREIHSPTMTESHSITPERLSKSQSISIDLTITGTHTVSFSSTRERHTDSMSPSVEPTLSKSITTPPSMTAADTRERSMSMTLTFSMTQTRERKSFTGTQTESQQATNTLTVTDTLSSSDSPSEERTLSHTQTATLTETASVDLTITPSLTDTLSVQVTSGKFYLDMTYNVTTMSAANKTAIVKAFEAIYPEQLTSHVILSTWNEVDVVIIDVVGIPPRLWEIVRTAIMGAVLTAYGVDGPPVDAVFPVVAEIPVLLMPPVLTICADRYVLSAQKPFLGKGFWTSMNSSVVIISSYNATTLVTGLMTGLNVFVWNTKKLYARNNRTVMLTRTSAPEVNPGTYGTLTANTINLNAVSINAPAQGTWTVAFGKAALTNKTLYNTAVEGVGTVVLQWSVAHPLCPTSAATVTLNFPTRTSCTSSTTCTSHGICDDQNMCQCFSAVGTGFFAGIACDRCQDGYIAPTCLETACRQFSSTCVNGNCVGNTCQCYANLTHGYWGGAFCDSCAASNETGFWTGLYCNVCKAPYYGSSCNVYCDDTLTCSGHGQCHVDGSCLCYQGSVNGSWGGLNCERCISGVYGANCLQSCSPLTTCNGHGLCAGKREGCTCVETNTAGYWTTVSTNQYPSSQCNVCKQDYSGASCTVASLACHVGVNCINGQCNVNATCTCYRSSTLGYWMGTNCTTCMQSLEGGFWSGATCTECLSGYWGSTCQTPCLFNQCNGHGKCSIASNGHCTCFAQPDLGFWLDEPGLRTCVRCASGYFGASCTNLCNASNCVGGYCNDVGTCLCYSNSSHGYYTGPGCRQCQVNYDSNTKCKLCVSGFSGSSCSRYCTATSCSGRGTCLSGVCTCNSNFQGSDCERCVDGYSGVNCNETSTSCLATLSVKISSFRFGNNFGSLVVEFTGATDQAAEYKKRSGITDVNPPCTTYFATTFTAKFGENPKCVWANSTMMFVFIDATATIRVADVMTFNGATIKAVDSTGSTKCSTTIGDFSIVVQMPTVFRAPKAIVVARQTVGVCEGLDFDAGSSFLSSPKITFRYFTLTPDRTALTNYLLNVPSDLPDVVIPSTVLPVGTTVLAVELTDYFTGAKSQILHTVQKVLVHTSPVVYALGSATKTTKSNEVLRLEVVGELPPCLSNNATLKYRWTIDQGNLPWNINSSTNLLVFPPGTLKARTSSYTVECVVTITLQFSDYVTQEKASVTFQVSVEAAPFSLVFTQGSQVTVARNGTLVITASVTDPEETTPTSAERFSWDCAECPSTLRDRIRQQSSAEVQVGGLLVDTSLVGTYEVVLTYSKASRSAKRQVYVTILSEVAVPAAPTMTIIGPADISSSARFILRVTGIQVESYRFAWSCLSPCPLSGTSNLAPMGYDSSSFVLGPYVLVPGTTYVFQVVATHLKLKNVTSSIAKFSATTRDAPVGGRLVTGTTTVSSFSKIDMYAPGWVGDSTPLSYCFDWIEESGNVVAMSACSPDPRVQGFVLPATTTMDLAMVRLTVINTKNESAVAYQPLFVTEAMNAQQLVSDLLQQSIDAQDSAKRTGIPTTMLKTMTAVASTMVSSQPTTTNQKFWNTLVEGVSPGGLQSSGHVDQYTYVLSQMMSTNVTISAKDVTSISSVTALMLNNAREGITESTSANIMTIAGTISKELSTSSKAAQFTGAVVGNTINTITSLADVLTQNKAVGERTRSEGSIVMDCLTIDTNQSVTSKGVESVTLTGVANTGVASLCSTKWGNNIFRNVRTTANATSHIVSVNMHNTHSSAEEKVKFFINIPITGYSKSQVLKLNRSKTSSIFQCSFFNFSANDFSSSGCSFVRVDVATMQVVCACSHMTDFAITPPQNRPKDPTFFRVIFSPSYFGGSTAVGVIAAIMAVGFVVLFFVDQSQQKNIAALIVEAVQLHAASGVEDAAKANIRALTLSENGLGDADVGRRELLPPLLRYVIDNNPYLFVFRWWRFSHITMPRRWWSFVALTYFSLLISGWFPGKTGGDYLATIFITFAGTPFVVAAVMTLYLWIPRSSTDARHAAYDKHLFTAMMTLTDVPTAQPKFELSNFAREIDQSSSHAPDPNGKLDMHIQLHSSIQFTPRELYDVEFGYRVQGCMLQSFSVRSVLYVAHSAGGTQLPWTSVITSILSEWLNTPLDVYTNPFGVNQAVCSQELIYMWSWEANACVWRLAIEAVLAMEFRLASALFETCLLMSSPELIFVFLRSSSHVHVSHDVILHEVCENIDNSVVGRSWCAFYAQVLHHLNETDFCSSYAASSVPNSFLIQTLLGLGHNNPNAHCGCVEYELEIEIVPESPGCTLEVSMQFSTVCTAHLLRFQPKPSVSEGNARFSAEALESATNHLLSSQKRMNSIQLADEFLRSTLLVPVKRTSSFDKPYSPYLRHSTDTSSQTNFYQTIEYGRFLLMIIMCRGYGFTFEQFSQRYHEEEEMMLAYRRHKAIRIHPSLGLKKIISDGERLAADLPMYGSNHTSTALPRSNTKLTYFVNKKVVTDSPQARYVAPGDAVKRYMLSAGVPKDQRGTGSVVSPHLGWKSLQRELRMGDHVYMIQGNYDELDLDFIHSNPNAPILFRPVGYTPAVASAYESGHKSASELYDCVHHVVINGDQVGVSIANSTNVRVEGVTIRGNVGVVTVRSTGVVLRYCHVISQHPALFDVEQTPCPEVENSMVWHDVQTAYARPVPFVSTMWLIPAYLLSATVVILLLVGCLFVSSSMNEDQVGVWVGKGIVGVVVNAFGLYPAVLVIMYWAKR